MVDKNDIKVNNDDKLNNLKKDKDDHNTIQNTNNDSSLEINKQEKALIDNSNPVDNNSTNNQNKENKPEKFINFTFYKVDPKWRWLNEIGKDESSREFLELLKAANTKMKVRTYSTIGLRHDSEFMIWTVSSSLENIQIFSSKIYCLSR